MSKRILFLVATHGDEAFAIDVLKNIERQYDKERYGYDWIVANPRALTLGRRFTDKDLNRSAPGSSTSLLYEERRAAELIKASKDYNIVIDLHGSVANCGIVAIVPYPSPANMALARRLPVSRCVVWYAKESDAQGPLTQHMPCPALEIECGPKSGRRIAAELRKVIADILEMNARDEWTIPANQDLYSVYGAVLGQHDPAVQDFKTITLNGEKFTPFMSNQYGGTLCYKMRPIDLDQAVRLIR